MAMYPTVPVCIQLTDYELESPHLGVAPIYSVVPSPPPPYNPSLYPSLYNVEAPHHLPQYVALVGIHPMHQNTSNISESHGDLTKTLPEEKEIKVITKEVILNKKDGKFGIKTAAIHKSIVIYKVSKGSAAAQAGLKMGDQLIKINGTAVTGLSNDKVHELIRHCPPCGVKFSVRSRKEYTIFKKLDSVKKSFGDV